MKLPRKPAVRWQDVDYSGVEDMAANGMTMEQIAGALGISESCWYRAKRHEPELAALVKKGRMRGIQETTNGLMALIRERNLGAIIFFMKCRGGWNENQVYIDKLQAEIDELRAMLTPNANN